MGRKIRWSAVGAVLLSLALTGQALAAVAWTAPDKVSKNYSWNYGNSMDMTTDGDTEWLHIVYANDASLPQRVFYSRSSDGGTTWSKPRKVSGAEHAERVSLAADGDCVHIGYVTQVGYFNNYDPADPRYFYTRSNCNHGAKADWQPRVLVSDGGANDRVDFPIVAASNGRVYATWTDSNNGDILFARSGNNGASFSRQTLGDTDVDQGDGEGFYGIPNIGAAADNVAVVWYDNQSGDTSDVIVRGNGSNGAAASWDAETDTGDNWSIEFTWAMGGGSEQDDRVGISWVEDGSVKGRIYDDSGWGSTFTPAAALAGSSNASYNASIEPYGTDGILIAFADCRPTTLANDCNWNSKKARVDLSAVESTDNGTSFGGRSILIDSTASRKMRLSDGASIQVDTSGATPTRYVTSESYNAQFTAYAVFLNVGTGAA